MPFSSRKYIIYWCVKSAKPNNLGGYIYDFSFEVNHLGATFVVDKKKTMDADMCVGACVIILSVGIVEWRML